MSIGEYQVEAAPLQFALYLEGVRVPFIRAIVESSPNRPATATISLPPFATAMRIRPRTLVDLFYWDAPFVNQKLVDASGNTNPAPDLAQWRLLFTGETTHGPEISQNESSRTVDLVCQDVSNYWHHVYQYFINNQRGMAGSAIEIATFVNGFASGGANDGQPLVDLVTMYNLTLPGQGDDIVLKTILGGRRNTILAGLADLIVKIGGESSKPSPVGVNRFFRDAELRLKMARRTFFFPDTQLANFIRIKADFAIRRVMNQISGELSGIGTVHDLIKKFTSYSFYDYVNFLAPPFGANPSRDIRDDGTVENVDLPDNLPIAFNQSVILGTMLKPKTFFLPPPRCNLMFPSQITRFKYGKSFLDEPTRLRLKVMNGLSGENVPLTSSVLQELAVYAPPMAAHFYADQASDTAAAQTAQNEGDPAFLDVWNSVRREYGFDPNGDNLIFDPTRDISEPETGIIPAFDTMDQAQALNVAELAASGSNPQTDTIQSKIVALLGNQTQPDTNANENLRNLFRYYMSAANYQLDLKRYAQRSVRDIEGPFNPKLLIGFPGAILNPTALILGELALVRHVIDAETGATTSSHLSHARTFPIPSFISTLEPSELAQITFFSGGSTSFKNDPVTGARVSAFISPVDGAVTELEDRNAEDVPAFLNQKFTNATSIDSDVYQDFPGNGVFGTRAIFNRVSAIGGGFSEIGTAGLVPGGIGDQYAAATAQYIDYLKAPDKHAFVNFNTRRNVTTINQARAHYGIFLNTNPVFQDEWRLLATTTAPGISGGDEFLYGGPGAGPVFKSLRNNIASKQSAVMALTRDMRISLGKDSSVSMPSDFAGESQRAGASSGG